MLWLQQLQLDLVGYLLCFLVVFSLNINSSVDDVLYWVWEDRGCTLYGGTQWCSIHKIEATKFTEAGCHEQDVDQIMHDLISMNIRRK